MKSLCVRSRLAAALGAALGLSSLTATADPITLALGGGWQATIFDPVDVDLAVDYVSVNQNLLVLEKFANFNEIDPVTLLPMPVNILFTQVGSDAGTVSRLVLTDEILLNNSGVDWTSFRMTLQGGAATFDPAASATLSIDPYTTATYSSGDTEVEFAGGSVAAGSIWTPGVAAGGLFIDVDLSAVDPVSFVLKELPVPEPSAALLLGAGLLLGLRRR